MYKRLGKVMSTPVLLAPARVSTGLRALAAITVVVSLTAAGATSATAQTRYRAGVTGLQQGAKIAEWGKPVASGGPGPTPTVVQDLRSAPSAIDAGNDSDLAVMPDGTVWAWGHTEVASPSMKLVQVPGLADVVQDPVDGNHDFAAIEQHGTDASCPQSSSVYTWGLNQSGDLGIGSTVQRVYSAPQLVTPLQCQNVVQLAAGNSHMFALTASGDVYVWGASADLALGLKRQPVATPVLNSRLSRLTGGTSSGVQITAGSDFGGILVDGQAYTWGNNAEDQCGCGLAQSFVEYPQAVAQGTVKYVFIDEGGNLGDNGHTLALTAQGAVWAWGDGLEGQLGVGSTANSDVPLAVQGLPPIRTVRAGGMFSLFLDTNGNEWACGDNSKYHEVGNGSHVNQLTPVEVLSNVADISAGSYHSISLESS
jgi:hypothetical protein